MTQAYIALGANLGDARATVNWAVQQLSLLVTTRLLDCSSLYRTAPIDAFGPDFINAVAAIETGLKAPMLLQELQRIEQQAGRERPYRHAPRTLDLDLLLYGEASINSAQLQVPHPRMFERAFVLVPLAEIAPQKISSTQLKVVDTQAVTRI